MAQNRHALKGNEYVTIANRADLLIIAWHGIIFTDERTNCSLLFSLQLYYSKISLSDLLIAFFANLLFLCIIKGFLMKIRKKFIGYFFV